MRYDPDGKLTLVTVITVITMVTMVTSILSPKDNAQMNLRNDLESWDGKSVPDIELIYERHSLTQTFLGGLLTLSKQQDVQVGATWMLKRYLEQGGTPSATMASELYESLDTIEGWETTLHVLQCIPYLPVSPGHREKVERFLRAGLLAENKFVRAWSFGGFYHLASQFPQYQSEVNEMFETAMENESPSVRARIRQIRKGN